MHENGVFHRDLKFENILLSGTLELKIADFGLSINISDMKGKETTSQQVGTKKFMPPEVVAREEYVPAKFDIFSAGVILFTLYSGFPPF